MSVIRIRDRKQVLEVSYEDVKKYHGSLALMAVAVGFRSLQAAFSELYGEEVPNRKDISILSGHAGPGFRDAFEYVTRAVPRGAYQVNVDYPVAQFDPFRPQSYAFVISTADGKAVEVALRDGSYPHAGDGTLPEWVPALAGGRKHLMIRLRQDRKFASGC